MSGAQLLRVLALGANLASATLIHDRMQTYSPFSLKLSSKAACIRACHEATNVTRNIGPMFFVDLIYIKTEKNKILKKFKFLIVQKLHYSRA